MAIYPDKKNGRLTGRFRVEVQSQGRRMRGRFDTLSEARQKEQEFIRALKNPQENGRSSLGSSPFPSSSGTPKTLLEALAENKERLWGHLTTHKVAPQQVETCAALLAKGLEIPGDDVHLSSITTDAIDNLIEDLQTTGKNGSRADATVNRHLAALHKLLKWCRRKKYIAEMPEFEWLLEDGKRIRSLSLDEEKRLLELLEGYGAEDVADFCRVAIDTGMRRSEILKLEPQDIDGNWARLWETKTKSPRSVRLSPRAREVLTRRHNTGLFNDLGIYRIRHFWDKAKDEMGLTADKNFVVHAMRHTCASRMVAKGIHVTVVKKHMGHSAIVTTMRYAHIFDDQLEAAAEVMWGSEDDEVNEDAAASLPARPKEVVVNHEVFP